MMISPTFSAHAVVTGGLRTGGSHHHQEGKRGVRLEKVKPCFILHRAAVPRYCGCGIISGVPREILQKVIISIVSDPKAVSVSEEYV